ncbi:YqgE/AlgH family protein [Streptomyces oryzae]|uniref:YqgE/AlgH family protein n=1 Tax=Streptomyces oryzae TaxID=1434886 RepID=A0ABS3XM30_9ACTN|nr:YqgE/AlgH family protein [Streptomyces oryzae]
MTEVSSLTGRLLVATPVLADPNFDRAVVLLLDHDEEGSLGVVLNRPTPVDVSDILEPWAALTGEPGVVFQGGPVSLDAALGVAVVPSGRGDRTDGGPARAEEPAARPERDRTGTRPAESHGAGTGEAERAAGPERVTGRERAGAETEAARAADAAEADTGPENGTGAGTGTDADMSAGPDMDSGAGADTGTSTGAGTGGGAETGGGADTGVGTGSGAGTDTDTDTVLDTDGPLGWRRVHGAIGLVDLEAPPELLAAELGSLRIFAGYAGWGPGQLEKELSEGAWYVVESEPGDVSSPAPERLWRSVLRRQRSELALVATYPDDPSLN